MYKENALNALKRVPTVFKDLYGHDPIRLETKRQQYISLLHRFDEVFPGHESFSFFSTPGRTEVGGNHTDHNAGRVLAGAVDLDVVCVASPNSKNEINIKSDGYPQFKVNIADLEINSAEIATSISLVRGICSRYKETGKNIGGFDAYVFGQVPKGSGLSSSAAFEVAIATILSEFFNDGKVDPVEMAIISQYAENHYFGKPCGLMDQTTCAVGGLITIDFRDFSNPLIEKVNFDFMSTGYSVVIVDTGGNHADLTDEYAALASEMKSVAVASGGLVMRDILPDIFIHNISKIRGTVNDRALLRAFHFLEDNERVLKQVAALHNNNLNEFLQLIIDSGRSSWMFNQNIFSSKNVYEQGISIALIVSEYILRGKGAWRVHGGGFAGTIQAFVPKELLREYIGTLSSIFGLNSCHTLMIRNKATCKVDLSS